MKWANGLGDPMENEIGGLTIHSAVALFQEQSEEVFQALKADIKKRGQKEAVLHVGGKLLDGRARVQACCELGIVPVIKHLDLSDANARRLLVEKNLKTRSLNASQRAVLACDIEDTFTEAAGERMRSGVSRLQQNEFIPLDERAEELGVAQLSFGRSRDLAARLTGASTGYVAKAKLILKGAPELMQMIRNGQITIPSALRLMEYRDSQEPGIISIMVRLAPGVDPLQALSDLKNIDAIEDAELI